jgi:hypothetical protein
MNFGVNNNFTSGGTTILAFSPLLIIGITSSKPGIT